LLSIFDKLRLLAVTKSSGYHLNSMHCRALPVNVLPHQPRLLLDYLNCFDRVSSYYQHKPQIESILRLVGSLDYPAGRRQEVATILRQQNALIGSGPATVTSLDRLANGAVAVVSGQQVGLFGGPAYAFYKAIAAVRIARDLTEQGIDAVPVFWMATEDHDLDEVRRVSFFGDGKLVKFELPANVGNLAPVGRILLGSGIEALQSEALALLGVREPGSVAQILSECYTPDETYGSAFGKLFARLLAASGLILLDPLDLRLHQIAEPIFAKAIEQRDSIEEQLLDRGKALEKADYGAQVKVSSRSTVLFHISRDGRQAIASDAGKFESGGKSWTKGELLAAIHNEPENFSPNALLRPVVQDFLLPTVAYIGGPSEISYFAQSEVLYRNLLGRMPVMLPRAGFTLVDTKAQRLLKQYGIEVEDVWNGSQELRSRLSKASVPENIANLLEENGNEIKKRLAQWSEAVAVLDPTLKEAVETAQQKIAYQAEKLQQKIGRALDHKLNVLAAHEEFLSNLLYPEKSLQSRELCFLPFAARWGQQGFEEIERHSGIKNIGSHFIIPVP
jgi:bacillithiol biosynthesis cysteine-adding enzyme BshC